MVFFSYQKYTQQWYCKFALFFATRELMWTQIYLTDNGIRQQRVLTASMLPLIALPNNLSISVIFISGHHRARSNGYLMLTYVDEMCILSSQHSPNINYTGKSHLQSVHKDSQMYVIYPSYSSQMVTRTFGGFLVYPLKSIFYTKKIKFIRISLRDLHATCSTIKYEIVTPSVNAFNRFHWSTVVISAGVRWTYSYSGWL